jgi:hypothetical protein
VVTKRALLAILVLLAAGCSPGDSGADGSPGTTVSTVPTTTTTTSAPVTTTTTLAVTTTTLEAVAEAPPSQPEEDALRDGVIPEIAELPFNRRVRIELEETSEEGVWMLTRLSRAVVDESMETGCGLGDPLGVYPIDIVCTLEYGELLLVDDGTISKAYPMPGAPPSWIHVTDDSVYAGHIGDGGLPDSTLVRIDRDTLEATVVVIPAAFDGGTEWLPTWHIAPAGYSDTYDDAVHVNSNDPGTPVSSWIGDFTVDLDAIDQIITTISTAQ